MSKKPIVGIGAGGHAKIILDVLLQTGEYDIRGLVEAQTRLNGASVLGIPVIGGDDELIRLYDDGVRLAFIGVASLSDIFGNKRIFDHVCGLGFEAINVVHPSAIIASTVRMGCGNRILTGAIINPDSVLGNNVVINTGAIVEHDCRIEDHAQVAPGARLAGNVHIGEGSVVGIGATVIQGVRIGRYTMIGAGAVVIKDVPDNKSVVGVPARAL